MARKKNWDIVKYSNDFAMRPWGNLNAFQQDILACLIVSLRERNVTEVHLSSKKLERLMQRRIRRDRIAKQISDMRAVITSIKAEIDDEKIEGEFVVFPGVWREKDTGDVVIQINEKYKKFFNNLSHEYLKWDLLEHMQLPTVYSKTLYRYLCKYHDTGWWQVDIEDLKALMNIPTAYDTKVAMNSVICPSVNTLRERLPDKFGDLSFERIKDGTRLQGIKFAFTPFEIRETDDWESKATNEPYWPDDDEEIPF